jgi:hypothetical protein
MKVLDICFVLPEEKFVGTPQFLDLMCNHFCGEKLILNFTNQCMRYIFDCLKIYE